MLFNLTHEENNYVSGKAPNSLPEENFAFVEIHYTDNHINSIKGSMNLDNLNKECILSDLDISIYMNKLEDFLKREDIDKDKIQLNFIETIEDEDLRIKNIFLILLSSYLIYFNFLEFPFVISLDLLTNEMFLYFTNFSPTNSLEKSFIKQVSLLHRYFSTIFVSDNNDNDNDNDYDNSLNEKKVKELVKELIDEEVKNIAKDIKEFKRKLLEDVKRETSSFKEKLLKAFE